MVGGRREIGVRGENLQIIPSYAVDLLFTLVVVREILSSSGILQVFSPVATAIMFTLE